MTKGTYTFQDGKFVPKSEARKEPLRVTLGVIPDTIDPIKHRGEVCTSRKRFDQITKEHGLEYGVDQYDFAYDERKREEENDKEIESELARATMLVDYGESLSEDERELCKRLDEKELWEANN